MDQRDTTQVVRMLTPDERKEMLESINSPADLRKLPVEELPVLARALRDFMVESVSKTGGHLSSSLGATAVSYTHLKTTARATRRLCNREVLL